MISITKCKKCGCELSDSPPNLDICDKCLIKMVIDGKEIKPLKRNIKIQYDEG
jgi:hypothetical protein